jgi:hypothetical protein
MGLLSLAMAGLVMQGQWAGVFQGTNSGEIVVDIDDMGTFIAGHAYLYDNNPALSGILVPFTTTNKNPVQALTVSLVPLHPNAPEVLTPAQFASLFPNMQLSATANITMKFGPRSLRIKWQTASGTHGTAMLSPSRASRQSKYIPKRSSRTWQRYKEMTTQIEPDRFIFRGQSQPFRLRTAFHRSHRKDLYPFILRDIPYLHRALTAQTRHLFNLNNPTENGAFWNLLQHHGYPTPLLDWTHSPFVAAFFAYRYQAPQSAARVRIFRFDQRAWMQDFNQLQVLINCRRHFSILEALAIDNPRAIPQQSLSSITNIDDIEGYISEKEAQTNRKYLEVFDLPVSDRVSVLKELKMMGITSGSMFPGIEGTCQALRAEFFGYE